MQFFISVFRNAPVVYSSTTTLYTTWVFSETSRDLFRRFVLRQKKGSNCLVFSIGVLSVSFKRATTALSAQRRLKFFIIKCLGQFELLMQCLKLDLNRIWFNARIRRKLLCQTTWGISPVLIHIICLYSTCTVFFRKISCTEHWRWRRFWFIKQI